MPFHARFRTLLLPAALAAWDAAAAPPRASPRPTPRQVVERFDSLLEAGSRGGERTRDEARALTTGAARRVFTLLWEARIRMGPVLDTAASRDTVLEEARAGDWAALKIRSEAVFRKPLMGLDRLESTQAVHLHRDSTGWRIADFEEVAENQVLVARAGPAPRDGEEVAGILPLSRLAPEKGARVTRMRIRVSARGGDSLPPLPEGPGRRVLRRERGTVELETFIAALPDRPAAARRPDSLDRYLASTRELDLSDDALRTKARELKRGSPHDLETARRVAAFVSASFDYRLGAALFGTSREALRDRRGDCSEAAVLTAALLRAAGIPSRVVLGFATLERGVWIGHAWVEAWIGGGWVGLDAALREFPAGAGRVALQSLSGEREMRAEAANLMLRALAGLDIQVLAAWDGARAVPLRAHPDAEAAARAFWDQVLEGMGAVP